MTEPFLRRARRIPRRLRGETLRGLRRIGLGPDYVGYVEGIRGDSLTGWVIARAGDRGNLPVGLYVESGLLATAHADGFRPDVHLLRYGDGHAGFSFRLTDEIYAAAAETGGRLSVRVLEGDEAEIGHLALSVSQAGAMDAAGPQIDRCRRLLYGDLKILRQLLAELDAADRDAEAARAAGDAEADADGRPPAFERHGLMFATDGILPDHSADIPAPSGQAAYLDYVAYRYRENLRFDRREGHDDNDHFLYWYLTTYRAHEPWRVPLSRRDIDYLNQPLVMGGVPAGFSRMMWWRLAHQPNLMAALTPNDTDRTNWFRYWWCFAEVRTLGFEDCLVPARYIEAMQAIHPVRRNDAFGLSTFTEQYFLEHSQFHFLDMGRPDDRRLLILCLLLKGLTRPDLIRYLPPGHVEAVLRQSDGGSDLQRFAAAVLDAADAPPLDPARFARILRRQGFDLGSRSFLTVTRAGDRFEAAALPAPAGGRIVDVQMIGPFRKASGLGQATRLSARIMAATGYSTNAVDFGMDNPAPEGFSRVGALSGQARARINLIQLNAESIPLVFAYQPDVFSGAYNIAYVFWELDTPALSHYLGMKMIDEIWVSTDYGVSIYQPHTDKPVTNVGMCYEDVGEVDRARARAFVTTRLRLEGPEFVFLVAFDSFSFVQRKNPVAVLEAFRKAFPDRQDVRLVVKTQNRNSVSDPPQVRLWRQVDAILARDSRIRLINETLDYDDLLLLKKGSDCYISLHKSEGWGFGMIEAMNLKVPVVCTAYSGNMDFCSDATAWLVDYRETELGADDYIFVRKGQKWAEPDIDDAARQLRAVWSDPAARAARAEAAFANVRANFSAEAVARRYQARLDAILKDR